MNAQLQCDTICLLYKCNLTLRMLWMPCTCIGTWCHAVTIYTVQYVLMLDTCTFTTRNYLIRTCMSSKHVFLITKILYNNHMFIILYNIYKCTCVCNCNDILIASSKWLWLSPAGLLLSCMMDYMYYNWRLEP